MGKIQAGYRITITSWENDADNYATKIINGLSKVDLDFVVDFIKLYRSRTDSKDGFGNLYEPSNEELKNLAKAHKEVLDKHPQQTLIKVNDSDDANDLDIIGDYASDLAGDFFGYSEYYTTRVLDNFLVEYVPQEIILEEIQRWNRFD